MLLCVGSRILHLGNVAQNGYLNAKFQRRLSLEADVACDERDAIAQPEWEEARVPSRISALGGWPPGQRVDGWERPEWVLPIRTVRRGRRLAYAVAARASRREIGRLHARLHSAFGPLREALGSDLTFDDTLEAFRRAWLEEQLVGPLARLFGGYDLVQAYGGHAVLPLVAASGRPYVAFEHGTLRDLPWQDSSFGRLTALGFRCADATVVTNADVIDSARRLGLEDVVFIPHPIDERKYAPGPSKLGRQHAAEGIGFAIVAPARQDWREKGNDVLYRGVAPILRARADAVVYAGEWGVDLARSRALVRELEIGAQVRWLPPVPKVELLDAYRAADVVLDQFVFGTFGGIAPEALACGKPVAMAFDAELHRWCFPEPPPIVATSDEAELAKALDRLAADPAGRAELGAAGRSWVERHHGWKLVAERHRDLYERVLATASRRETSSGERHI